MTPTAFQWLPVGLGVAVSLLGLLGLGSSLLPGLRTKHATLVADSALYFVTGVLLVLPVFAFTNHRAAPVPKLVEIGLTSDPEGAEVYLDGVFAGHAPLTFQRPKGALVRYRVQAGEAAADTFAYESYAGEVRIEKAVVISVWLDREPLEP